MAILLLKLKLQAQCLDFIPSQTYRYLCAKYSGDKNHQMFWCSQDY